MTKKLLKKELRLALHPTALLFLLLSAMVLIPSYPYYVVFFYTGLGVFFTCLSGRENHDVSFTLLLPVSRRQLVAARFGAVALLELAQVVAVALFALVRRALPIPPNAAGMEANLALLGLALPMLGLFHLVFFGMYYRDVNKVGAPFGVSAIVTFVYIVAAEALCHTVPFFRDRLDTPDPLYLPEKLAVLAAGAAVYILLTLAALGRAQRRFAEQDI